MYQMISVKLKDPLETQSSNFSLKVKLRPKFALADKIEFGRIVFPLKNSEMHKKYPKIKSIHK